VRYVTDIVSAPIPPYPLSLSCFGYLWPVANYNKADRDGKTCYLNTAQYEPNVAIYERLGFKVGKFAEVNVEDDSIEVYYVKTSLIVGIWHVSGPSAGALVRTRSIKIPIGGSFDHPLADQSDRDVRVRV
jgi:hypothetical protein